MESNQDIERFVTAALEREWEAGESRYVRLKNGYTSTTAKPCREKLPFTESDTRETLFDAVFIAWEECAGLDGNIYLEACSRVGGRTIRYLSKGTEAPPFTKNDREHGRGENTSDLSATAASAIGTAMKTLAENNKDLMKVVLAVVDAHAEDKAIIARQEEREASSEIIARLGMKYETSKMVLEKADTFLTKIATIMQASKTSGGDVGEQPEADGPARCAWDLRVMVRLGNDALRQVAADNGIFNDAEFQKEFVNLMSWLARVKKLAAEIGGKT